MMMRAQGSGDNEADLELLRFQLPPNLEGGLSPTILDHIRVHILGGKYEMCELQSTAADKFLHAIREGGDHWGGGS